MAGPYEVGLQKWKELANQVLGEDFFSDFIGDVREEGPSYNLYRNSSEIIVLINLPYVVDISKIHVNVRDQEIVVKGKLDYGYDHMELVHRSLFSGSFERTIPLPSTVNTKRVNAQYRRGLLIVQLFPKLNRTETPVKIQGK